MGGAASSLQRARKIVVIKSYNSRGPNETLAEQFEKLAKYKNGVKILVALDIKKSIGLSQPWFDELLVRIAGNEVLCCRLSSKLTSNA